MSYSSVGDWNLIKRQIKVPLEDLNQKMGIQISIPDPLKRQMPSRRYGGQSRSNYSRGGRSGGYGRSTEVGDSRDDRGGRKRYTTKVVKIATADVVDGNNCKT